MLGLSSQGCSGSTWTIAIEALPQFPYLVRSHDKPLLPVMVTSHSFPGPWLYYIRQSYLVILRRQKPSLKYSLGRPELSWGIAINKGRLVKNSEDTWLHFSWLLGLYFQLIKLGSIVKHMFDGASQLCLPEKQ